ncbi:MAG: response regulator transcription factor [Chloroflexi bacterium]|nr:response regulator transcription factor [Chloroflexota bacterium]MCH8114067.1 response regulator transcription factor [Chloroflexota bacterium]MCI0774725.1 response regulator transcription factor [Chloroflexota bacterium]MCI0803350.1 response regulator transcription factor [Chloroflexota bacterium]MCI0808593.1 response regulator transcription factor [Chloroflexota bacterium]
MDGPIRVLIADDHPVVRSGLRALIETETGMEIVGDAADGKEAIEKAGQLLPDIVLLDLMMPGVSGLEAIEGIRQHNSDIHILVLTSFDQDDLLFPAIKAGAHGYLLKDSSPEDLLRAIRQVSRGESSLHPTIARKLIREFSGSAQETNPAVPLSKREHDVLELLALGLSNQEIANSLTISERTARKHVSNILDKLHVSNRTQAALFAVHRGIG